MVAVAAFGDGGASRGQTKGRFDATRFHVVRPASITIYFVSVSLHFFHEQDEHEINIIHNTAREWLEGNRGELLSEKMQGHADIAKNSVKAMSRLKAIDIERWNTSDIMRWTSESNGIDPPLCYGVPYSI